MSDVDEVQERLDALDIQQKLHVFDIHTEHNLHPPQDALPRLSDQIVAFLRDNGEDTDAVLRRPALKPAVTHNSFPFTDYFISSSHNTYLLTAQILGTSSEEAYTHVLSRGCRCVEIDVWPSKSGPIVTHGYTLSISVPFAKVCRAIGSFLDNTYGPYNPDAKSGLDFPVLVSLECHVPLAEQGELVRIMKEAWGDRLVQGPLEGVDDEWITPKDLEGRIVVMVEYYPPPLIRRSGTSSSITEEEDSSKPKRKWSLWRSDDTSSSSESSDDESSGEDIYDDEGGAKSLWPFGRKKKPTEEPADGEAEIEKCPKISDDLADLGYYARSMKPAKGWLSQRFSDVPHIMINISESACSKLLSAIAEHKHKHAEHEHSHTIRLPSPLTSLIHHSSHHLRRIFPRGTRIMSSNLDPSKFWRSGSQVVSLNWQKYDKGVQMNEGLFVGTHGWVLKPEHMRKKRGLDFDDGAHAQSPPQPNLKLKGHVVGVSSMPAPNGRSGKSFEAYIRTELLYHHEAYPAPTEGDGEVSAAAKSTSLENVLLRWKSKSIKVQHHPELGADGVWNETWEWEYERDELAFIRLLIYEDEFGKDDRVSTFCSPVERLVTGEWLAVRLMNKKGKDVGTTALVKFELEQVDL
ncbi:hypothetical protein MD484_g3147, partial [Candolleomyces efflorescens]